MAQTEKALYEGKLIDFALGSKDNKQQCDKKSGPCPFGVLVCKCDKKHDLMTGCNMFSN